jgi:regulator of protease activity HflC (stomatin/prohibitin superfamily)
MTAGLIVLAVLVVVLFVVAASAVRIVPQARAGIVERLGRYQRTLQPGLALIIPFVDRVKPLIDLREQVVSFPPQPVITEDNLVVGIDTVIYFQITDSKSVTYEVANPLQAIEQLTVTTLRNVIGGLTLEETLTSRDKINTQLRVVLDEATGKWGSGSTGRAQVGRAPRTVQETMEKQMRAERERRAAILTAEGVKQSRSSRRRARSRPRCSRRRAARTSRSCAPRAIQGDRDVFRPSLTVPPTRQLLSTVPADAARARQGRGQQDLRDPERVLPGLGGLARPLGLGATASLLRAPARASLRGARRVRRARRRGRRRSGPRLARGIGSGVGRGHARDGFRRAGRATGRAALPEPRRALTGSLTRAYYDPSACSTPSPTSSRTRSRACASVARSRTTTSPRRCARSASRCSKPTSISGSSRSSPSR